MILFNDNKITIDDNNYTITIKNASSETLAILEDFEKDFGFSLNELPNLDLPLDLYVRALEDQVNDQILAQLCDEDPHWDCETDAYDRFM
jgi:hypothetical protein